MLNWTDEQAKERDEELRRFVEKHRAAHQAAQASAQREPSARLYGAVLARLGRGLETLGRRLQDQSGSLFPSETLFPPEDTTTSDAPPHIAGPCNVC